MAGSALNSRQGSARQVISVFCFPEHTTILKLDRKILPFHWWSGRVPLPHHFLTSFTGGSGAVSGRHRRRAGMSGIFNRQDGRWVNIWGSDHFSRQFKRLFGMSPGSYRRGENGWLLWIISYIFFYIYLIGKNYPVNSVFIWKVCIKSPLQNSQNGVIIIL